MRDDVTQPLPSRLAELRPRLVRALIGARGLDDAEEAAAEAIAWALANPDRMAELHTPIAYLYRVALTRSAPRKRPTLPPVDPTRMPDVEPGLIPALLELPDRQRAAVWLVHACGWRYGEVADALGISRSAVGTHVSRALHALRQALGVNHQGGDT